MGPRLDLGLRANLLGSRNIKLAKVYFLGAGASHEAGVPLSNQILAAGLQLLESLSSRQPAESSSYLSALSDQDIELISNVYDWIGRVFHAGKLDTSHLPPLDIIWGLADIAIGRKSKIVPKDFDISEALINLIQHVVAGCRVIYDQEGNPSYDFSTRYDNPFTRFVEIVEEDAIFITTNYDLLLERAIKESGKDFWYGLEGNTPSSGYLMIKLHGSFNWRYCAECDEIYVLDGNLQDDKPIYAPNAKTCPRDGSDLHAVMIPPSLVQVNMIRSLQNVWKLAHNAIRTADGMAIIGYSMPDADLEIIYLLRHAMYLNKNITEGGIEVVDSRPETIDRYKALLGAHLISEYPMSFDEYLEVRREQGS